ncbi:MAG TPA: CHASE domain-containing protein [Pyrinomonadaceae bacterium]|nr:CHASE domain-containing protein [Pyrinomonadaceae bacterium]
MKWKNNFLGDLSNSSILRIPYFVLTISIIVTIAITYFYYSSAKTNDSGRFESQTVRVKSEIESRLDTYSALLRAGRSYFYATDTINKEDFRQFVANLNLRQNYPGVLAIGFSKVFIPAEKESFIKKMRNEGLTDFVVKPDTPRDEYQAIIYIEPFDDVNKQVIGFDMSSEAIRESALKNARDTGNQSITGKVILAQQEDEEKKQTGFLIYFPIYKSKSTPETVEERRKKIDGFIYSPFRSEEFVADVIKNGEIDELSFKIYDTENNERSLLVVGNPNEELADPLFRGQNEINIGGRTWIVTYSPTAKFYKHSLIWWTPIIFFLGLAISVVLFYLSLSQSWTNQRLIKTANDLAQLGEKEREAREDAERSAKVKDEFLATISHELRTPLNAIAGWVNIIKLNNIENETKEKAIGIINKNLRQQVNLIEQMIIFSDMESFLSQANWQKFSLTELVTENLNEAVIQISKKKLKLIKDISSDKLMINGDKDKIKKAISILVDNSIKFTPQGGEILIELNSQQNKVLLKVVDSGEGILPELMPNIFEGFRQSDSSSIRKHGGLGLSLAIAKKIIESHRGKLTVKSDGADTGTTIMLVLPLAR